MKYFENFDNFDNTVYFTMNKRGYSYKLTDTIPDWNESFLKNGSQQRTNYYIASLIEKMYDYRFKEKEMVSDKLTCKFSDDKYRLSISTYMSSENFQIVLCIKQLDGKYLRSHTIDIESIGKLLDEIEPWRKSDRLKGLNKDFGTLD